MSDLISRADAIEAVCRTRCGDKAKGCPAHSCLVIEEFDALPSAETHDKHTETHGVCLDLISKDDAMGAVQDHFNDDGFKGYDDGQKMMDRINALPSAEAVKVAYICDGRKCEWDCSDCSMTLDIEHAKDFKLMGGVYFQQESAEAEQTVIRSRTLMPTKDFKEWAKRVREENPNVIVIPCDAEVVSTNAEWIPCSERLPEKDGWYLVTVQGYETVTDVAPFNEELWKGLAGHQEVIAWMPLPEPYRKDGEEK